MRRQVVLPEPDGPSSVKNSPSEDVETDVVDGFHVAKVTADAIETHGRYGRFHGSFEF
jgi:hypothetical protein